MPRNTFFKATDKPKEYRTLTEGETKLAQSVFGDAIRYEFVKIYNRTFYPLIQNKNRAVAYQNEISCPGTAYSNDFFLESDPTKRSVFIHELVHVWQHQNDVLDTRVDFIRKMIQHNFNDQAIYKYELDPSKDLLAYNYEQQAAMIQDYFLLNKHDVVNSYKSRHLKELPEDELTQCYEAILKNFIKDPSYARMNEEKHYKSGLLSKIPIPKESLHYFPPQDALD